MKALPFILALVSLPALVAQAEEKAGAMEGYFPTDASLKRGAHVNTSFGEGFREPYQKFQEALQKLDEAKRTAYMQNFSWEQQPVYNADVWPNKADYDQLIQEWKKVQIRPVAVVAVGLQSLGNGIWRVLSATAGDSKSKQSIPLTLSAMRYDSNRNVWISSNGELTAKEYSTPDTNLYGAQTGTEWVLEKNDSLTNFRETIRVTKTTDGKYVYLAYSLVEQSAVTGIDIAQGAYLLQFPVQAAGANLGTPGQR